MGEFAPIYFLMAQRGHTTAAVDEMEVWEIGSVLGLHRSDEERDEERDRLDGLRSGGGAKGRKGRRRGPISAGKALLRRRLDAAMGRGPAPTPQARPRPAGFD